MIKIRKIFPKLLKELENNKILLLVGPRQVGKTTLLKQLQAEVTTKKTFFINVEDPSIKALLDEHPLNLFQLTGADSKTHQVIFVDEVQYLTNPSNFLKLIYDEYHENIKLVVSGSSSFYIDAKFKDSLMGRKKMFELFTLDFEEFLEFREEGELKTALFENKKIPLIHQKRIDELFNEYITYGGYPEVVLTADSEEKSELLGYLANDYIKKDIYDANIEMTDKFFALLKILASQTGGLVNAKELSKSLEIDVRTIEKYLYVMQKSYSIVLVRPFWSNVRAELTKMPKVFFFDMGLRNYLLRDFRNIRERLDIGGYFENIVWRELLFTYGLDDIKFRRTVQDNEVDFIIQEKFAYEVKFNEHTIQQSKYKLFREKYPKIPLEFITFDDILERIVEGTL